jgi:hypothetical protein
MDEVRLSPGVKKAVIILVTVSFITYGGVFLTPFAPLEDHQKVVLAAALFIFAEVTWVAALLMGRDYVKHHVKKGHHLVRHHVRSGHHFVKHHARKHAQRIGLLKGG